MLNNNITNAVSLAQNDVISEPNEICIIEVF